MWMRSAYWIGRPHDGQEEVFSSTVNNELIPDLERLPGVRKAKVMWPRRKEGGAPNVACQILVCFDSQQDIDQMLASSERASLRQKVAKIVELFDGKMTYIDFEVGSSDV